MKIRGEGTGNVWKRYKTKLNTKLVQYMTFTTPITFPSTAEQEKSLFIFKRYICIINFI